MSFKVKRVIFGARKAMKQFILFYFIWIYDREIVEVLITPDKVRQEQRKTFLT